MKGKPDFGEYGKATRFSSENQPANKGRKHGSRDKLTEAYFDDLHELWATQGKEILKRVAVEKPEALLNALSKIPAKDINLTVTPEGSLTDEEVEILYQAKLEELKAKKLENPTVN